MFLIPAPGVKASFGGAKLSNMIANNSRDITLELMLVGFCQDTALRWMIIWLKTQLKDSVLYIVTVKCQETGLGTPSMTLNDLMGKTMKSSLPTFSHDKLILKKMINLPQEKSIFHQI